MKITGHYCFTILNVSSAKQIRL